MEGELQELREVIAQLRADNERLRQEQAAAATGSGSMPVTSAASSSAPPPATAPLVERLVFVPRERKCPMFRGRTGIGLAEWIEEAQACMRARHLSISDQAYFLFDHLEGEAREEIKFRHSAERGDPAKIISVLQELYGCSDSYVVLQDAFFARRQQEGETLQEFSLALMSLMASVKRRAPSDLINAEVLLRDQFVEHVIDGALRRELKQFVRRQPTADLFEVRAEAIRWEREGLPAGFRGRSHSVPCVLGFQCGVKSEQPSVIKPPQNSELSEMREMLKLQQEQLNKLTQSISQLQNVHLPRRAPQRGPVICRRCQQPGHFARECDRLPMVPRSHSQFPAPQQTSRQTSFTRPSEN